MIVLKIIGWVIFAILALILLVLCIKVRIFAEYSEADTHVKLQWLFLKIPLYPSVKKDAQQDNASPAPAPEGTVPENTSDADTIPDDTAADTVTDERATEEGTANTEAAKPKNNLLKTLYEAHGIDGLLLIVQRVFSYLGSFIGDLMHSLVIEELFVDVRCTKSDAASTAIYYGEVCSSLFPMLGALVSKYKVRKYDINVYPDYLAKHSSASFAVAMHLYPIYVIAIVLLFAFRMLFKVVFRLFGKIFLPSKSKKAENSNSNGSTEPAEKI